MMFLWYTKKILIVNINNSVRYLITYNVLPVSLAKTSAMYY